MKRLSIILMLFISIAWGADAPFGRGVNLTGWLQTSNVRQIQFTKFTKQDFINIKSLGCDVIRLPINLHFMTDGAPNYTIDPLFFYFLDQIVDWSEELDLHLLLDNHTFDPAQNTDPNIGDILIPVWTQMAEHYKNSTANIYYEVLNEPHGISDSKWNTIQQEVVHAIRAVDSTHTIIIGPAGWNSYNNLKYMPEYEGGNLLYTFHFYDPFLFTHQGASWTNPSMGPLAGMPFPYDAARMPDFPDELRGTWIESAFNNYANEGTVARVKELIDIAVDFKESRNVPIFCGEFGVYMRNSNNEDRVYWYDVVRQYFEEKNIPWTIWDYTGGFGLFEQGGSDLFDYDLNIPLVEALGLNAPPQKEFVLEPDSSGFDIYTDFICPYINESSWAGGGIIDFYADAEPVIGRYCIHWTNADQYNNIGFAFKPIKDLSVLESRDYALDFWVKCDAADAAIDIRFVDTKTDDPEDHPWRMRYTLDGGWSGSWQHLQIPLQEFTEHGSWDDGWFPPQGDFDWRAVERFEIVAEHQNLKGVNFWFDNMRIVDPAVVGVDDAFAVPTRFRLEQNYPNPFNPSTRIAFELARDSDVELSIYNAVGQKVRTLVNGARTAGLHAVVWDGLDDAGLMTADGVYFYRLRSGSLSATRKMVLMR